MKESTIERVAELLAERLAGGSTEEAAKMEVRVSAASIATLCGVGLDDLG